MRGALLSSMGNRMKKIISLTLISLLLLSLVSAIQSSTDDFTMTMAFGSGGINEVQDDEYTVAIIGQGLTQYDVNGDAELCIGLFCAATIESVVGEGFTIDLLFIFRVAEMGIEWFKVNWTD